MPTFMHFFFFGMPHRLYICIQSFGVHFHLLSPLIIRFHSESNYNERLSSPLSRSALFHAAKNNNNYYYYKIIHVHHASPSFHYYYIIFFLVVFFFSSYSPVCSRFFVFGPHCLPLLPSNISALSPKLCGYHKMSQPFRCSTC